MDIRVDRAFRRQPRDRRSAVRRGHRSHTLVPARGWRQYGAIALAIVASSAAAWALVLALENITQPMDYHTGEPPGATVWLFFVGTVHYAVLGGLVRNEPLRGGIAVRIRFSRHESGLHLTVNVDGDAFDPEQAGAAIASLRERLATLSGNDARLELRRGDGRSTEAILDIPYEPYGPHEPRGPHYGLPAAAAVHQPGSMTRT